MYAVINYHGRQYKVSEGEELLLDKLVSEKIVEAVDVNLIVDGEKVLVGTPNITGAKVALEVLGDEKGKKVTTVKYKAKSRYRKKMGFRPQYTRVKVQKISVK
ncbi:MAG: 50S ribosomal protein L21 [bacterium]|nr:50S ribosomal protein L21 [bacterium]